LNYGEGELPRQAKEKKETKIGTYIEQEAAKRNLSLRAMSKAIGVDEGTLAHIVSGRRPAELEVCRKLADFLKTDPCYLLELAEKLPPRPEEGQQPDWLRNVIYRLSHGSYSKKTIDMINVFLNEEEKNET
jgi:transcriptional regulator with XRE-family HTH domain